MPVLSFKKTFDATIKVGEYEIQIEVSRLNKAQLEDLDEQYTRLVQPRGNLDEAALAVWNKEVKDERYAFFADILEKFVRVPAGQIENDGQAVVDGAGLLQIFHGRRDVLRDIVAAVITQNHLIESLRKNSPSPRASEPGSDSRIPTRGGDAQGSTAGSAASSLIATPAAAMDANASTDGDGRSPSSDSSDRDTAKVH